MVYWRSLLVVTACFKLFFKNLQSLRSENENLEAITANAPKCYSMRYFQTYFSSNERFKTRARIKFGQMRLTRIWEWIRIWRSHMPSEWRVHVCKQTAAVRCVMAWQLLVMIHSLSCYTPEGPLSSSYKLTYIWWFNMLQFLWNIKACREYTVCPKKYITT
jgi:hypothetical protein